MLLESLAVGAVPALARADGAATNHTVKFKMASSEDLSTTQEVLKTCKKNTSCLEKTIAAFSTQAHAQQVVAVTAYSPDMDFITSGNCVSAGAGEDAYQRQVTMTECQLVRLGKLQKGTDEFLSKINASNFEEFLALPDADKSWQVQLFNEACKGSRATHRCFQSHMKQLKLDLDKASPALSQFYHKMVKASGLSEALCPAAKESSPCEFKAFRIAAVLVALPGTPGRPVYKATLPAPPPPPPGGKEKGGGKGKDGAKGTGGWSDKGKGQGGGGNGDGPNSGPGEGNSDSGAAGTGNGATPGIGGGGGVPGGIAPKEIKGAKDGVKGGTRDCGVDPFGKPIDCNTQSLIPISDPSWEVVGPMAQCPAFLKPYNCLGMGSNRAGDLANIRNAPFFAANRERMCRELLFRSAGVSLYYSTLASKWPDPSKATLSDSPGCNHWIQVLKNPDPVPALTREEIDTARVAESGKLYDALMNIADIASQSGLQRDLGAYAVEQKVIALFQVSVNLNPGIIVDEDPQAYAAALAELLGAASCLSPDDQDLLRVQLKVSRDVGLAHAQEIKTRKTDLDKQWVEGLAKQSEKVSAMDRSNFDLSHLWSRLRCDQSALGDARQCLKYDYQNVATVGSPVSAQVYDTRLRWIREELGKSLAEPGTETDGINWAAILGPGKASYEDPNCSYIHCSALGDAIKSVRHKENDLLSGNPLLAEKTGAKIQRLECGADPAERDPKRVRWSKVSSTLNSANTPVTAGLALVTSFAGADETACEKPQAMSDKLAATADPAARLGIARAAAASMRAEGLQKIRGICAKPEALSEEGKHAAGVPPLAQGFLNCQDVGEYSVACADRRSFGWAMCRLHMQNVADGNTRQYHEMFQGMAMAAGGALAIMATAGGAAVIAGALGLGMSATSIYMRHEEIAASAVNYEALRSDFIAKLGDAGATKAAWDRMSDAQKYAIAGDIFDLATAALDVHALSGALKAAAKTAEAARVAKRVLLVDQLITDGKDLEALAHARRLRGAEETLAEIDRIGGASARAELVQDMRANLRRYGPVVDLMPESELATLQNLDSRLRVLLREGLLDEAAVNRVRRLISEALVAPEKLAQFAGTEVADLYHEMQASGRFAGTGGKALQDRFVEIFEGMLRLEHPELTEELWRALGRDEKLAILEGRLAPAEAIAKHPPAALPPGPRLVAAAGVADARGTAATAAVAQKAADLNASDAVAKIRERYRVFAGLGEADNARYIAIAHGAEGESRLFFEAENAVLKQLNDSVIANKDTVTALSNQYKEIIFRNIEGNAVLGKKLMAGYSDFKSLRLVFTESSAEVVAELEKVYRQSAQEFEAAVASSPLRELYKDAHGISGSPASWHLAGIGSTADEASVAARSARPYYKAGQSLTPLRTFSGASGMLADRLAALEDLRAELQSQLGAAKKMFVSAVPGSPRLVLSEDGFEILRKIKAKDLEDYIKQVQDKFETRFKVKLSPDQVINIRDYAALVDGYTASIVTAKRVVIDMSHAEKFGVLSFDMAGAGAANLERTAGELAAAAGVAPGTAVVAARKAEGVVTQVMNKKLQIIRDSVKEVLGEEAAAQVAATGDDVYFFPKNALGAEQRQAIQRGVTRRMGENGFSADRLRTTYQPSQFAGGVLIPPGARSTYIVAAEKVEKGLRTSLEGTVGIDRLKQVGILVEYTPGASGDGFMSIRLTGKVDPELLEQVRARARTLMPEGVQLREVTVAEGAAAPGAVGIGAAGDAALPVTGKPGKVAVYNPAGEMDNCVACTSAFLHNKFAETMKHTADTLQAEHGGAGAARRFNLPTAIEYIQTASDSKTAGAVAFMEARAPPGAYAIFYGNAESFFHVVSAWITPNGRKFIFDAQIGLVKELKGPADWTEFLNRYKASRARAYQFTPNAGH